MVQMYKTSSPRLDAGTGRELNTVSSECAISSPVVIVQCYYVCVPYLQSPSRRMQIRHSEESCVVMLGGGTADVWLSFRRLRCMILSTVVRASSRCWWSSLILLLCSITFICVQIQQKQCTQVVEYTLSILTARRTDYAISSVIFK